LLETHDLIAKSPNGTEIIVSLIPINKMQSTRQGFKKIEVEMVSKNLAWRTRTRR
jgi:hypothetical protein